MKKNIYIYHITNYLYSRFLVFVQTLHFYFNVVIRNVFNFTFETDLLRDSINSSFLRVKIKLSASPPLHQAPPIIAVIIQINARLRLTVAMACVLGSKTIIK